MKKPNFAAMNPAVAEAIKQMMAEQGDKFSLEKINLADLGRRTGISRAKLRRMKEHDFEDVQHALKGRKATTTLLSGYTGILDTYHGKTARVLRDGDTLYIYSSDMAFLLTTHNVTWARRDSFCENQYALPKQPEEFPTMPVKTVIKQLPEPVRDLSFEKFNFSKEDGWDE